MGQEKLTELLDQLEKELFGLAGDLVTGKMFGEIKEERANSIEQNIGNSITLMLKVKQELNIPSVHRIPPDKQ